MICADARFNVEGFLSGKTNLGVKLKLTLDVQKQNPGQGKQQLGENKP